VTGADAVSNDGAPTRRGLRPASFAAVVRARREEAGLTQEALAERSGLSVRTVSDLERGIHPRARRSTLDRLIAGLDLVGAAAAEMEEANRASPSRAALPAMLVGRPDELPLVGREGSLGRIEAARRAAWSGHHGAVLCAGEAGIGKSRLLAEAARAAHAEGAVVLAGRCREDVSIPFGPLVEAVRPHLSGASLEAVLDAVGPLARYFALVVPQLAAQVAPPPADADHDLSRMRLFEAADRLFTVLGGGAPVVLVVDDLHAADRSTLGVLAHLVGSPRPEPLFVLGAFRSTEIGADHPLVLLMADLVRSRLLDRVELDALGRDSVEALVAARSLGTPSARSLDALREHTGGNPFFVEEVLRSIDEEGRDLDAGIVGVPSAVRAVVHSRVARLSEGARSALGTLAVIGDVVERAVFDRVVEHEVTRGLDEAMAGGFVESTGDGLAFRHGIVRAALLQDVDPEVSAAVHWRVGRALEQVHAADPDDHVVEVAHHLRLGVRAGDPVYASEVLERAALLQFRATALDAAAQSSSAALALLPAGEAGDRARVRILELLAETHFWRDDPDAMRAAALAAAELAAKVGSVGDLARTALVAARWNRPGQLESGVLDLLDLAVERIGPDPSSTLSQLLSMRAYVLHGAARGFDTRSITHWAEEMARQCGDVEALTMALLVQTYADAGAPTVARTARVVHELEATAGRVPREDHRKQFAVFALRARAHLELVTGNRGAFDATRVELASVTADMRARFVPGQLRYWASAVARAEGHAEAADDLSAEALATWHERPDARRAHDIQRAAAAVERGDAQVLPEIERLVSGDTTSLGYAWRAVLAGGYAGIGDDLEARRRLDVLAEGGFEQLADDHHRPHALRWLAECIVRLDDEERADELLPVLRPYAGLMLIGPGISTIECAADRSIAQLLAVLGNRAEAASAYESAMALEAAMGFSALAARTRRWMDHDCP